MITQMLYISDFSAQTIPISLKRQYRLLIYRIRSIVANQQMTDFRQVLPFTILKTVTLSLSN